MKETYFTQILQTLRASTQAPENSIWNSIPELEEGKTYSSATLGFGWKLDTLINIGFCSDNHWVGIEHAHTHIFPVISPTWLHVCVKKPDMIYSWKGLPANLIKHEYIHVLHAYENRKKWKVKDDVDEGHGKRWTEIAEEHGVLPSPYCADDSIGFNYFDLKAGFTERIRQRIAETEAALGGRGSPA